MDHQTKRARMLRAGVLAVLVLALVFAFSGCRLPSFGGDTGGGTTEINGTYRVGVGDETVQINDSDVAEKVAYLMMPATVEIFSTETYGNYTYSSGGTGFIVSEDGYVVTNAHVLHYTPKTSTYPWGVTQNPDRTFNENNIKLQFYSSDEQFGVSIVAFDVGLDLAVLKFNNLPEGGFPRIATFADSDSLNYGQIAVAIGNANGLGLSVTSGVISAPSRTFRNDDGSTTTAIQTDTAINPGNSGGPLFNKRAEVVGVNSFKLVTENTENMGYAIPSNITMNYLDEVAAARGISINYRRAA